MNVGDLRKIIADLPDDQLVMVHESEGGRSVEADLAEVHLMIGGTYGGPTTIKTGGASVTEADGGVPALFVEG